MTDKHKPETAILEETDDAKVLKVWNKPTLRVQNAAQRTEGGPLAKPGVENTVYSNS